ncbi:MAG: MBL fold metallo-hydrolase [Clostridia bacterium]|nr:MBL fold metallo-hydrolase [Clostridia bacterium]
MKRKFCLAAAIVIALSILLTCCGGGLAAGNVSLPVGTTSPETTNTPGPAATAEPTATLEPTGTPELTTTPEPTATAEPTATPEPTGTPEPTATEEPTATPAVTEAPLITVSPRPTLWTEADDIVPPSPEPPDAAKQGRPTPGPTEIPSQTIIDHINYPKELRDFRFRRGAKLLEIWFPNIRDADAAILTFDGQVYMIDCGDEKSAARTAVLLKQLGIEKIDILFNSHLHHDHINGLALTDDAAKVGEIKICFPADSTASGEKMAAIAEERKIPVTEYQSGDWFTMGEKGEVTLLFLRNYDPMMDMNNQSAVTVVRYKDRSILFTADMEKNGQAQMLKHVDPALLNCDIIKYPHHAKNALYDQFYKAVEPKFAVVTSVQGRRDLGQSFLVGQRIPAAYTSVKGQFVHLVTDGEYWLCEYVSSNGK